jgi:hypothetical protein
MERAAKGPARANGDQPDTQQPCSQIGLSRRLPAGPRPRTMWPIAHAIGVTRRVRCPSVHYAMGLQHSPSQLSQPAQCWHLPSPWRRAAAVVVVLEAAEAEAEWAEAAEVEWAAVVAGAKIGAVAEAAAKIGAEVEAVRTGEVVEAGVNGATIDVDGDMARVAGTPRAAGVTTRGVTGGISAIRVPTDLEQR